MDPDTGEVVMGNVVGEAFDPAKWDDNVAIAQQSVQDIKEKKLILAVVTENVIQRWGKHGDIKHIMETFANKSGIAVSTLYEYRRVYRAFPDGGPAELDHTKLRNALKHGTTDNAHVKAAEEAATKGLTARSMERRRVDAEQKPTPEHNGPEKVEVLMPCPTCNGSGEVPA